MALQFARKRKQPAPYTSASPRNKTVTPDAQTRPILQRQRSVLQLQRRIGNNGVPRSRESRSARPDRGLTIAPPDSRYEREADSVAERVLRAPAAPLQRQAAQSPQARPLASPEADGAAPAAPAIVHDVLRAPGQRLDAATRGFMEQRFGQDFSGVRVHSDGRAAASARAVDARAYTVGRDVAFGAGQYAPGTAAGKALLAHELTHVLQQRASGPATGTLQRYRRSNSVNFGARDTATLKEKQFDRRAPDPYVAHIRVDFTGTKEADGETVPKGTLSATYADNGASPMPANISGVDMLGGFPSSGLTDKTTNNKVDRVEGWGYHDTTVPSGSRVGPKWPQSKYFKPALGGQASMSFALFFKGKIAIHAGSLDTGSLACVHVDDDTIMRRLNYHTRAGVTKVTVTYNEAALKIPCCERYAVKGFMVSNPCGDQDADDCP